MYSHTRCETNISLFQIIQMAESSPSVTTHHRTHVLANSREFRTPPPLMQPQDKHELRSGQTALMESTGKISGFLRRVQIVNVSRAAPQHSLLCHSDWVCYCLLYILEVLLK